jgi:hypothetical protein
MELNKSLTERKADTRIFDTKNSTKGMSSLKVIWNIRMARQKSWKQQPKLVVSVFKKAQLIFWVSVECQFHQNRSWNCKFRIQFQLRGNTESRLYSSASWNVNRHYNIQSSRNLVDGWSADDPLILCLCKYRRADDPPLVRISSADQISG